MPEKTWPTFCLPVRLAGEHLTNLSLDKVVRENQPFHGETCQKKPDQLFACLWDLLVKIQPTFRGTDLLENTWPTFEWRDWLEMTNLWVERLVGEDQPLSGETDWRRPTFEWRDWLEMTNLWVESGWRWPAFEWRDWLEKTNLFCRDWRDWLEKTNLWLERRAGEDQTFAMETCWRRTTCCWRDLLEKTNILLERLVGEDQHFARETCWRRPTFCWRDLLEKTNLLLERLVGEDQPFPVETWLRSPDQISLERLGELLTNLWLEHGSRNSAP